MSKKDDAFLLASSAFEALLTKYGVRVDYFTLWAKQRIVNYGDPIYQQWTNWAKFKDLKVWLYDAFKFDTNHIPATIWYIVSEKWDEWILANLKK